MRLPRSPHVLRSILLASLFAMLLVGAPATAQATAPATSPATTRGSAQEPARGPDAVASTRVVFDLVNTNDSTVLCLPGPDGRAYQVRGRLVGPRDVVSGRDAVATVNVLVHDAGTGSWFFNLRSSPTYDYATRLAARGQTSLVLDRLGYGSSPLRNGDATCLGAQVHMLHQVVQRLYSGRFDYIGPRFGSGPPHFTSVVLQGHGTGATIAQLEAARFDDVAGLVLMAPASTSTSQRALNAVGAQARTCLGDTFAPYGVTAGDYRRLLFRTAPRSVQKAAVQRRNPTPCGDVASLPGALAAISLGERDVEVPVLVLRGGADARTSGSRVAVTSTKKITQRTMKGAGSALTLERSAPTMQRIVLRWLRTV